MNKQKTILIDLIFHFPNIPKSLFRFSKEGLTDKEKYLEIKNFMKCVNPNNEDNYWEFSEDISKFIINLYYNKVLTLEELFKDVFIDRYFCNPIRFLSYCQPAFGLFKSKSILEFMDFRMGLIKLVNDYMINNANDSSSLLLTTLSDDYNLSKFINIPSAIKNNLLEAYEDKITELIYQIIYNSFYEEELEPVLNERLKRVMSYSFDESTLMSNLNSLVRNFILEEERYKVILHNYHEEDFMILYLFFESYENSNYLQLDKHKNVIRKVYEERGFKNEK